MLSPFLLEIFMTQRESDLIIGGQGAITTTAAQLKTLMGDSEDSISIFRLNGNDVEAVFNKIEVAFYSQSTFSGNGSITSFIDVGNKITTIGHSSFKNTPILAKVILNFLVSNQPNAHNQLFSGSNVKEVEVNKVPYLSYQMLTNTPLLERVSAISATKIDWQCFFNSGIKNISLPNVTTLSGITMSGQADIFKNCYNVESISLPSLTTIGADPAVNYNNFNNIKLGCTITVPLAMATANAGSPDADLVHAVNVRAAIINYI
jgi:hypothetical protein